MEVVDYSVRELGRKARWSHRNNGGSQEVGGGWGPRRPTFELSGWPLGTVRREPRHTVIAHQPFSRRKECLEHVQDIETSRGLILKGSWASPDYDVDESTLQTP